MIFEEIFLKLFFLLLFGMYLRVNQISAILRDLKDEEICVCINEHKRVGRLYQLTPKGLEVYKFLTDMEKQN